MKPGGLKGKAWAKINLFLRVLRKRADGFHDIQTFFIPITLFDEITISPAGETLLFCNKPDIPTDHNNIILKTDHILRQKYGLHDNYEILLEKNIPQGAGLGGGSSDAACYLRLVNEASKLGLNYDKMVDIMAQVGSDTAFFINPKPALGSGRGEILQTVDKLPQMFFIIINPNIHISTKKVYENKNLVLTDVEVSFNLKKEITFYDVVNMMKNDLEGPVFALDFRIQKLSEDLKAETCGNVLMSGSGSSMFVVYDDARLRNEDYEMLKMKYTDYFIYNAEILEGV